MTVAIKGSASITGVIPCGCAINERAIRPTQSHLLFVLSALQIQTAPTKRGSVCLRRTGMFHVCGNVFFFSASFFFFFFGLERCHGWGEGSEHRSYCIRWRRLRRRPLVTGQFDGSFSRLRYCVRENNDSGGKLKSIVQTTRGNRHDSFHT